MSSQQEQITSLKLPGGTQIDFVDWQDYPTWSTVDLLSGWTDEEIPLFTYTVSDTVTASSNITVRRIASERDTNMATPGSAAGTQEFMVYSLRPELQSLTVVGTDATTATPSLIGQPIPNAQNIGRMGFWTKLQLIVSQKVMHEAPFAYYNPGFGAAAFGMYTGTAIAAANQSLGSQGLPSNEAVRSMAIPVHIGGLEKMRCVLKNPSGATVQYFSEAAPPANVATRMLQLRVLLDGLNKRPVA